MILDGTKMMKTCYKDSRSHSGESGQLYIYEDADGAKYLVKHKPLDVANEYVAHRLAMLLGVPTSDAVLILENGKFAVGIAFEEDFQRVNMDDFFGTETSEDDDLDMGYPLDSRVQVAKVKYSDDDPHLAEAMNYLAFRHIVVMDDNPQVAFAHGNLISFDYADAFNLTEEMFASLMNDNRSALVNAVGLFKSHLKIDKGYWDSIELLRRPNTNFLLNAYLDPVMNFPDIDFNSLFDELNQAFSRTVVDFYGCCLQLVNMEIEKMIKEEPKA